ncbi:MAG: DUF11 domain-containing protein [Bacteroidetes bacterium]|nr:DUF11 domain-containing protein [Bacteroidota bacterium]
MSQFAFLLQTKNLPDKKTKLMLFCFRMIGMLLVVGVLPTTTTYAQCTLTAEVTNITCNNMTTTTTADDKFSFTLTVNSTSSTAETGGYVSVSINGTNVGGQNIGEAKEFVNQYNISGGVLNVTITAGSGNCSTTTTITPPQACSPGAGCTWDPLNLNPPYVTVTVQRDCKGTSDESDDEVSGTFSVTGIPAGYAAELDRKLDANGNGKEHIEGGITNGQVVNWGPYNVNTVKYPGQNGFVLWFMLEGITDCLGDYFVMIPNCPACTAPTPTGTDASICSGETAILMASGCTSGYTATWFSNSTLTSQLETGDSYETPTLTTTTNYYVSCVKDGDATCMSSGVLVAATVKPLPTLTAGTPTCAQNGLTYSVTVTSNGTISADAGTVSGTTVSNIPAGTDVTITATLNGCTRDITVTSPTCQIPCTAPTPTGTGASVCPDNTATLTASGCTTGYTATWFSDAGLNNQEGTGNSFTTPVLTATTNYYVSCVKDADATCMSSGVLVAATVKPLPTLTAGTPTCAQNGLTYSVTVTSNGTISADAGTVSGTTVSNIPAGTDVTITATLNGCTRDITVTSPTCQIPCTAPTPTGTGASVCPNNTATLTASGCTTGYTATWFSDAGLNNQEGTGNSFTTPVLTATTNYYVSCVKDADATCMSSGVLVAATVKPLPTLTAGTPTCAQNGLTYSVTVTSNGTISADAGTVSGTTVSNIPAGTDVTITATLNGCTRDITVTSPTCQIPCTAPTPTGTGASVCPDNTATLTASGCTTGYTATWFSDAGLNNQEGTGNSFTTPVLTATKNYYLSCVKNGDATCKSSGVTVTATVKTKPALSITNTTCSGTTVTVTFTATAGATVTASVGTVSGNQVTGIPSGQTFSLTASLNGCDSTVSDSKTCAPNCDLNATLGVIKCIAGQNTPELTDDSFTFDLTVTGTGGASNLWEAVYNGTVIQTGAYGQTKTVTVSYSTWNGAANMAIIIRDKDNTSCTDNVSVQVPTCSPAPCTGFKFTNIVASCEGGLHKICLDVSGTGGRKWAISLKHSNDFNVPGIPFADGTGDQTGVCGTISSTDFAILQAFDADDFIVWGMLELSDGTPIFGTGCEIDSVVRYSPCVTCQAPTPVGTGASVCSGTSATLTASGCSTGYTTTWFSDAGLGTQVGTGTSYTTLVLTSNTNYYVACVKDGDATCKSSGVTVTATVKPKPTISVTSTTCNQAGTFYDVAFSATSGATVTADKGTVTGSTVVGVPSGQVVKLVVSLNGCKDSTTATKNCSPSCQAPTPVGTGASVCSGTSATLTASGCSTGYTTTWFSDAGLGTQVGTGTSYTTLVLTSNTNYYVACVKDGDATCKSSGVTVTATVKPKPTISVTSTTCNQAGTFYDVAFSATSGATVTADKGTVTGSTVVGVPSGQVVKLVVTLNGCKDSTTATKNCSVPCVESTFSLVGTPSCSADYSTYSLTIQVNNKIGIVKTNKGILSGNNPYTITGIPAGSPVIITDSLSAVCKADTMIVAPNCNCNPALPQLLTPSLTACVGDTFPTLKATVVGLATVEWFSQQTGGTVLATGLSFKPSGTVTANTIFYAQARSTDPTCPTAVSTSRVPATINAQDCTKEVDLALSKSISKKIARVGDVLTYTLKVWNESATNATGVSVTDSIATTVQFVSGSFSPSRGSASISGNVIKWNIGNIVANGDTVTLTYQIKVTQEGVHFNTAEICTTNEKDVDSTPCNHDDTEDDIDRACFTVPVKLCPGEVVEVTIPARYTNVQWFKSGSTTPVASGNSVLLTDLGSYTFTATNQTCPAEGCCPVIIEAGTNCCPVDLCIPFTIKQTKKAGKKL